MTPDFWIERWQNNRIGFHLDEVNVHLENHWDCLALEPGKTVFVPLCGKSVDMLWLADQGYPVVGNEISEIAAKAFFTENAIDYTVSREDRFNRYQGDRVTILCGDFFDLSPVDLEACAAVYDRASLISLPKAMRAAYADHIKRLLPGNVPHLLITLTYDQSLMDGPPFSVDEAEVHKYYSPAYRVTPHRSEELIEEEPRFKARGLDSLIETVYCLR